MNDLEPKVQLQLYKAVHLNRPAGLHKHLNMVAIVQETGLPPSKVWELLGAMYNLEKADSLSPTVPERDFYSFMLIDYADELKKRQIEQEDDKDQVKSEPDDDVQDDEEDEEQEDDEAEEQEQGEDEPEEEEEEEEEEEDNKKDGSASPGPPRRSNRIQRASKKQEVKTDTEDADEPKKRGRKKRVVAKTPENEKAPEKTPPQPSPAAKQRRGAPRKRGRKR